jgi:hypothetical protein
MTLLYPQNQEKKQNKNLIAQTTPTAPDQVIT